MKIDPEFYRKKSLADLDIMRQGLSTNTDLFVVVMKAYHEQLAEQEATYRRTQETIKRIAFWTLIVGIVVLVFTLVQFFLG